MLSRTAQNLFWTARYIERAESIARLVEMGHRMAMMPSPEGNDEEWRSVAAAAGCADRLPGGEDVDHRAILRCLILDRNNPSSITASIGQARANGRAVRVALSRQMWEALNDTWLHLRDLSEEQIARDLPAHLDWVKDRCALFRGVAESTLLRGPGYDFFSLGTFIERADVMLRLLDVKYYVLLPETEVIGGGRDHHQWTSVLHAASSMRAYHWVYRTDYSPWKIADFLLLNRASPRSIAYCYDRASQHLDRLGQAYGVRHDCHRVASEVVALLEDHDMGEIFSDGLHEFLVDMINRTDRLSAEIARAYLF